MKKLYNRIVALFLCFVITALMIFPSSVAHAYISWSEGGLLGKVTDWIGGTTAFDAIWGTDHSWMYAANKPQAYYTTPTSSTEDASGNVTNYYRNGDTTTTKIIDSYNQTFNTIHNTTNNTNNYSANVKLSDFLNSYTTYNNNYTYNTKYNSWYYDNTQNTLNYDASQTYYNTDNSKYYISIDNSTDEYYLVDVQYSPTYVTVNYTYNNIDNSVTNNYGNVTNIYYFELTDGRNSADLTVDEITGLDLGYDVVNYELVTDDPNTLSLQHFDGDYTDSSSYGRSFYSENRSTTYVDSGDFGQALKLTSGSAAGVTIPGLSSKGDLTIDFRIYYNAISSLKIYLGDTNLMQKIPNYKHETYSDNYTDNGTDYNLGRFCYLCSNASSHPYPQYSTLSSKIDPTKYGYTWATSLSSAHSQPSISDVDAWSTVYSSLYGWVDSNWSIPSVFNSDEVKYGNWYYQVSGSLEEISSGATSHKSYEYTTPLVHYKSTTYRSSPTSSIAANFSYSNYANQWVSMRITIADGKLYYFVNGDLVGSGDFAMPDADKFYIKSSGTLYLDELRITTGDMVSSDDYTPSSAPFDTNKVLAIPSETAEQTIYVRSSVPVTAWRIGGVRPSNPTTGFFYIPLHSDYTGGQSQIYDGSNWVDVDSVVYDNSKTQTTLGFTFSPVGSSADIADPEEKDPGEDPDDPSTDPDDPDDGDNWFTTLLKKIADFFGTAIGGLLELVGTVINKVLDSLITLVTTTLDKLTEIVDLFGSFGDALGALWTWLPEEIMTVLVAGVTVIIFAAVIKLFFR